MIAGCGMNLNIPGAVKMKAKCFITPNFVVTMYPKVYTIIKTIQSMNQNECVRCGSMIVCGRSSKLLAHLKFESLY